jgi:hypothetical protein
MWALPALICFTVTDEFNWRSTGVLSLPVADIFPELHCITD